MPDPIDIVAAILLALASIGAVFALAAAWMIGGVRPAAFTHATLPPVTILKPLHGDEPALCDNLATVFAQDYPAPVQVIAGVRDADDPALAHFRRIAATYPAVACDMIVDPERHGPNNKVSNLTNMSRAIRHPLIIIADSDVAWAPDTLRRLANALADPRVGLATCLLIGRGDAGFWSRVAGMDLSYRFIPQVILGSALGLARPALGPTMALRRDTLSAIGGFEAFCHVLADDYEIGRAVRALGLRTIVPPLFVTHGCGEGSLRALVTHELRWSVTIARIDRAGFAGSIVTHALPLAIAGMIVSGLAIESHVIAGVTLLARMLVKIRIDMAAGRSSGPLWLLPLRDLLSFAIFCASFAINKVDWRGAQFRVTRDGKLLPLRGGVQKGPIQ